MILADFQTMYRVMILFMLEQVEYPLTNTQITNMILDKNYTDYFSVQQALTELQSAGLILAESTYSNTRYRITETGRQTLTYLGDKISDGMKEDVLSFFKAHHYDLKNENAVYADFYRASQRDYAARCQIRNGQKSLIDLTITVDTREQARSICENWTKQSQEVYSLLMDMLLQ